MSACEQSGRAVVPEVKIPVSLDEWVDKAEGPLRLVLDPQAESRLSRYPLEVDAIALLVGPEGGLHEQEMKNLEAHGVTAVSLGRRVLRTESAGPAAIALLQAAVGDM